MVELGFPELLFFLEIKIKIKIKINNNNNNNNKFTESIDEGQWPTFAQIMVAYTLKYPITTGQEQSRRKTSL